MGAREREEREVRGKVNAGTWAKSQGESAANLKMPEGVTMYALKQGVAKVDFMPYIIGGDFNPRGDDGYEHFEREYDGHRVPMGGEFKLYNCRQKCFKEACAVCDWLRDNGGKADPDLVKKMRATTRHLWLINDDPGNAKNPFKVFDSNHYNKGQGFGEMMADALNSVEAYRDFTDLKNGYTVQLTIKELTAPGMKWNGVTRIDFVKRDYEYSDKMLRRAPCLDEMLIDPGYEAVQKLLSFGPSKSSTVTVQGDPPKSDKPKEEAPKKRAVDDDDEDPKPKRKVVDEDDDDDKPAPKKESKPAAKEDDEKTAEELGLELGDTVKHREHGKCKIVHISGDGTSLRIKDEDDDVHRGIAPNEVKKIEEEKPKKKSKDEDDDDDDEPKAKRKAADDDDKPAPKKKSRDVPLDDDDD